MVQRAITTAELANLSRALIGFDHIFNQQLHPANGNYPPYNIVKYSDIRYAIEVAVAGFDKNEITVGVEMDQLIIRGTKNEQSEDANFAKEYVHRGIASRNFVQNWTLAEYMEVRSAEVKNGMLVISIERVIPESLRPRQIEVK